MCESMWRLHFVDYQRLLFDGDSVGHYLNFAFADGPEKVRLQSGKPVHCIAIVVSDICGVSCIGSPGEAPDGC